MVKNSTSCAYKDINTSSEFSDLLMDVYTSINCDHIELIRGVLKGVQNTGNLFSIKIKRLLREQVL